jgi:hypothetical protein
MYVVACGGPALQAIESKNKAQQPIDEPLPPSNSLFKRTPPLPLQHHYRANNLLEWALCEF